MAKHNPPPQTLLNHRHSSFLVERWNLPHNQNDMYSCVFCARPGAGKSYSSMQLAWLLDRDSDDVPRFTIDRVCFSAIEFAHWLAKGSSLPEGSAVILDDAGLSLYSKQTMQKVCIELGKSFQSMRYKNLVIILNLPAFGMLEAHVRKLLFDYIEIIGRDSWKKQNLAKIQHLQLNPFQGETYRHSVAFEQTEHNRRIGIDVNHKTFDFFRFDLPPKELYKAYEKKKKKYLDAWSYKSYQSLVDLEMSALKGIKEGEGESQKKMSFAELYEMVNERLDECIDPTKDKVIPSLISTKEWFGGGMEAARQIAQRLNIERRKIHT